jgi:DNA helicase-2/ATP-dependent DNA helicase PcrA
VRQPHNSSQTAFLFDDEAAPEQQPRFVPTDEQRQAIEHVGGPMLVVAGAGTGKTTVLTERIARLITHAGVKPQEILAITYTVNSAHDLAKRLALALRGSEAPAVVRQVMRGGVRIGTFHAYCYSVLCDAGRRFELVDDQDLYVLLRRQIEDLKLEHFIKAGNLGTFLKDLLSFFRRCSDELRGPADYERYVADLVAGKVKTPRVSASKHVLSDDEIIARCKEIARVFRVVEEKLSSAGLGTYGHVISRAVELLSDARHAHHLQNARERARFILIDEFQDSNVAQIKLAKLLAGDEANVFAVGDPDQAIYRFRGATSGAFDQFLAAFGAERVKRLTMTHNRRSTESILKCAYEAIARNPEISRVTLPAGQNWRRQPLEHARTRREPGPPPPVHVTGCSGSESEAAFVVEQIERLHKQAHRWSDMAVLYRNHHNRADVVERLRARGIPFVVAGLDLLETSEVRDLLAVLRTVELGDAVAMLRVAALPQFEIDGAELRTVLAAAGESPQVEQVLERVGGGAKAVTALAEMRHELQAAGGMACAAVEIARRCFALPANKDSDYFAEFVQRWSKKPAAFAGTGTLPEFLDYLELFAEAGGKVTRPDDDDDGTRANLQMEAGDAPAGNEHEDAVRLMTVHAAKGLEFPVVFVARMGGNSFPTSYREYLVDFPEELRNRENVPEGEPEQLHKEEERRLFYVALTRAEDQLILCGRTGGKKNPAPAGYLRELLDRKHQQLRGHIEFAEVAEGTLVATIQAGAVTQPRILDWVSMPPLALPLPLRLSPSAIESYSYCPLRYKLERDWNLPEEPAAAMQFGQAIHTALMGYFDALRKGKRVDVETVIASFLDEFAKAKIEEPLQRELYERNGRRQLTTFLNSPAATPSGEVKLIEHRIALEIAGVQISGRIDRVDEDENGLTIVDYKTGRPKSQENADNSLQLSVYALAMLKQGPVRTVVFQNLEDGSSVATARSEAQLSKAQEKVSEVAGKIRAGQFDPRPGFQCSWCSYRMICPAKEQIQIKPSATNN